MVMDYKRTIGRYLGHFNFMIGKDIKLQDDGSGVYISYWDLEEEQPTMQTLIDIYNAYPEYCSVCPKLAVGAPSCYDYSTTVMGNLIASGTSLSIPSRTFTSPSYTVVEHNCIGEFISDVYTCKLNNSKKNINFIGTLDNVGIDNDFEILIYKNSEVIARDKMTSASILGEDLTLSVHADTILVAGDTIHVEVYNDSIISRNLINYKLSILNSI